MSKYRDLEVWKKSMHLVTEVYFAVRPFPKDEVYGITSQIKRAAVSIPANVAEGCGRQHKKETVHFLHIARGSLYELDTLLEICVRVNLLNHEELILLSPLITENFKLLNGFIKYYEEAKLT